MRISFILSESATLSHGGRLARTSFDSCDDGMTGLTEKLAIPAGNTAGLRLALPEPYNLQHGTGPFRMGTRLVAANILALEMLFSATEIPPYPGWIEIRKDSEKAYTD